MGHLWGQSLHLLHGVNQREEVDLEIRPQELVGLLRHLLDLTEYKFDIICLSEKVGDLLEDIGGVVTSSADIVCTVVDLK